MPHLIVFSHLRWNFVYQRPQQLMSRLSRYYKILFVEETTLADGPARLDVVPNGPGLDLLIPRSPVHAPGFHDNQIPILQPLLSNFLHTRGISDYLVWFYTPMALPLISEMHPRMVVYDCMDELSAFNNAPRQLRQRETALLKMADLVLTGGPGLHEQRRHLHPNVHCLPSSVDDHHFAPTPLRPATREAKAVAELMRGIPRPRLGFFGVIDERIDLALLEALAESRPDWQIIMVGPVAKIDRQQLPRMDNLHWLDMQSYDRLPHFLAAWDVCLMPFALNPATRFISPTKTLEYLAGGKPVVSTPVPDVIALYGEAVRIVPHAEACVAACQAALDESAEIRSRRIETALRLVRASSWDSSVDTIHRLITDGLARGRHDPLASPASIATGQSPLDNARAREAALGTATRHPQRRVHHLVIGVGASGQPQAHELGDNSPTAPAMPRVERKPVAAEGGTGRSRTDALVPRDTLRESSRHLATTPVHGPPGLAPVSETRSPRSG